VTASQPPHAPPAGHPGGATATGSPGPYAGPAPYRGYGTPTGAASRWSGAAPTASAGRSGAVGRLVTAVALGLAALLSLTYALWAFTARRGIFADFASGRSVDVDEARSNDRIDTVWLVIAGLVALVAVALWLMRKLGGDTSGGLLDNLGLTVAGVGVGVAVVGLFLASRISDGADQIGSGDRGVTASLVTGAGFTLLAIGLVLGLLAMRSRPEVSQPSARSAVPVGYSDR
jgi:hypothetical protein